jgi:hypothetical protein
VHQLSPPTRKQAADRSIFDDKNPCTEQGLLRRTVQSKRNVAVDLRRRIPDFLVFFFDRLAGEGRHRDKGAGGFQSEDESRQVGGPQRPGVLPLPCLFVAESTWGDG